MADAVAGSLAVQITADTGGATKGLADVGRAARSLDKAIMGLGADPAAGAKIGGLFSSIRADAGRTAGVTRSAFAGLRTSILGGLAGGAVGAAGLFGLGAAGDLAGGLAGAVKESVSLAAEAETTAAAFGVMTGSAEKAAKVIADLRKFAADSPFNTRGLTTEAQNLLASGVEAGQIVPTLRMLGDLAGGSAEKLGRLSNAYSQVRVAGKLTMQELLQFNNAGVPAIEALAGVMGKPVDQMRHFIEEGQVGFPTLVQAFKSLTEGAGRFAGLSDQYARTLTGEFEQLKDAAESLKREFGGMLVEELGLKGATKDLTSYVERFKTGVDDLRPGVRVVGELGRAAAQVAAEFARAAAIIADTQFAGLTAAVPELKAAADAARAVLKDLAEFKVDPVKVAEFGLKLTDFFTDAGLALVDILRKIGPALKGGLLGPFLDAAKQLRETAEQISGVIEGVRDLKNVTVGGTLDSLKTNVSPGMQGSGPDGLPTDAEFAAQRKRVQALLDTPLPGEAAAGTAFTGGEFKRRGAGAGAGAAPVPPPAPVAREWFPDLVADIVHTKAQFRAAVMAQAEAAGALQNRGRAERDAARAAESLTKSYTAGAALMGGTFDALGAAARKADKVEVEKPFDHPPHLRDLARKATDEFGPKIDPGKDFVKKLNDLREASARGLFDEAAPATQALTGGPGAALMANAKGPGVFGAAVAELFKDAARDVQFRLPTSAELGSAEAAKAVTDQYAQGPQDVKGLLQFMADQAKQHGQMVEKLLAEVVKNTDALPVPVKLR